MSTQLDKSALGVRYLLGELSEEERQSFEKSYFTDDRIFEDLQLTEAEVVDAYVANELADGPRKHFEKTLATSPRLQERLAFARSFAESLDRPNPGPVPVEPWWKKVIALLFGAGPFPVWGFALSVIVLVGIPAIVVQSIRLRNESRSLETERAAIVRQREELARLSAQERDRTASELREAQMRNQRAEELLRSIQEQTTETAPGKPTFASVTLFPGLQRSGSQGSEGGKLRIAPGASEVRLQLKLLTVDYRNYRVTINDPAGKENQHNGLRPTRNKAILLRLPASSFPAGKYTVKVNGVTPSGEVEPVSDYEFRVTRTP